MFHYYSGSFETNISNYRDVVWKLIFRDVPILELWFQTNIKTCSNIRYPDIRNLVSKLVIFRFIPMLDLKFQN